MFAKKETRKADPTSRGIGPRKVDGVPKGGNAKTNPARQTRRAALGDLTNNTKDKTVDDGKKKVIGGLKPKTKANNSQLPRPSVKKEPQEEESKEAIDIERVKKECDTVSSDVFEHISSSQEFGGSDAVRKEEEFSFIEETEVSEAEESMLSFDRENKDDVFHVGLYAEDIFKYYKRREHMFQIRPYMGTKQCHITPSMRRVLVDWLVEIQENFELNHETLYLAVKLSDLYLSRVELDKEYLQLLGSAAVFIASKFDERCPPLIEDFTYICDNAFDRGQFIEMEMELLRKVDFDLGIPISYRFLRRYAKVGRLTNETLTLARYILEMSLMEYDLVKERDSMVAAAALYIAMRMRKEGAWEGDIVKSCGYELDELKPLITTLNKMLLAQPSQSLQTIHSKYSHIVFHEVAKIKPLPTNELL